MSEWDEKTAAAEATLQAEHKGGTDLPAIADRIKIARMNAHRGGQYVFNVQLYMHESVDVENALRSPRDAGELPWGTGETGTGGIR